MHCSWTKEQEAELAKSLTFAYKMQNTYKEPLDLEDRVAGWKFVLEEDYTMELVLYGLKKFLKKSDDMPVPSNIDNILNPEEPKVTQAAYIQACKDQERNGFKAFSAESMIITDYEKQNSDEKTEHDFECDKMKELCGNSMKRIEEN